MKSRYPKVMSLIPELSLKWKMHCHEHFQPRPQYSLLNKFQRYLFFCAHKFTFQFNSKDHILCVTCDPTLLRTRWVYVTLMNFWGSLCDSDWVAFTRCEQWICITSFVEMSLIFLEGFLYSVFECEVIYFLRICF